jgi:hypothetical protein
VPERRLGYAAFRDADFLDDAFALVAGTLEIRLGCDSCLLIAKNVDNGTALNSTKK